MQTLYDEQGRAYRTLTFGVDPATGAVSATALSANTYYDLRSNVLASSQPGGLWTKSAYDGAGRMVASYSTDGAGGTSWSAASNVTGDHVLEQTEAQYDRNGNTIATVVRQRFDDQTGTGPLGTATAGVLARVYNSAAYYDLADRVSDNVAAGTNGGVPWARPATVPPRSDTVLVTSADYDPAGRVQDSTDPKGIVTRQSYDQASRTTGTVEDYTDGVPTNDTNKTTNFGYNSAGLANLTAQLVGGHQTTGWQYGVSTATGSGLNSDEIAAQTQFPDPTTGDPSSSQQETVTVNALGETTGMTDRNGTVHSYSRDVLGRLIADAVTTLGAGVDGAVRRIETAFDTQGNAYLFTSFDSASGGSVLNQVQRQFNGLQQLIAEYQEHGGAVNVATTPKVQYTFAEMAGGANNSRPTSLIYPNGRVVTYSYAAGLDDGISRLSSVSDPSATLESYLYLGLGTVVRRAHPQPGVDLTYLKLAGEPSGDAGDKYAGLDRFGRVVDQRWINSSNADVDRYQYTYDRNTNRLTRHNLLKSDLNELYSYDYLNQISSYTRGGAFSQSWRFDALGNWGEFVTNGVVQSRTHNRLNEITSISNAITPQYDANGNMIGDETGKALAYDAWKQLVGIKASGGATLALYAFDGLRRRVQSTELGTSRDMYYSIGWQVLEERVSSTPMAQYVWSQVYIDCMILRDRGVSGTLDERFYPTQDANWNVTSLVDYSGDVQEIYIYEAYGKATIFSPNYSAVRSVSNYDWSQNFQGMKWNMVVGLYLQRIRWYALMLGRWLTMDLLGPESNTNNYWFVNNNPINNLDPLGLQKDKPEKPYKGGEKFIENELGGFAIFIGPWSRQDGKKGEPNSFMRNGSYVQMAMKPSISCDCDKLTILQIASASIATEEIQKTRPWASTDGNFVDQSQGNLWPYYGWENNGTIAGSSPSTGAVGNYGQIGGHKPNGSVTSETWPIGIDRPHSATPTGPLIEAPGRLKVNGPVDQKIIGAFVCAEGKEKGKIYGWWTFSLRDCPISRFTPPKHNQTRDRYFSAPAG